MQLNLFKRFRSKSKKLTFGNFGGDLAQLFSNSAQNLDFPIVYKAYSDRDFMYAYEIASPLANAVDLIGEQIQAIKPKIFDIKNNEFIDNHPLLELLKNPNSFCSGKEFMQRLVVSFLVTGNSYLISTMLSPNSPPLEIFNHLPQDINIEINSFDCYPDRYITYICGRNSEVFSRKSNIGKIVFVDETDRRQLFQIKNPSMRSGTWRSHGYSKLNAIMYEIALYLVGTLYNRSMLENQGRPVGVISPDMEISEDQAASIAEQIRATTEGSRNAGRTLILPVGIKYNELSKTAKDMEYSELIKRSNEAVYNRFGIPLALIQGNSLSLANMKDALPQLYSMAVIPVLNRLFDEMTRFLMPKYKGSENFILSYDSKEVKALIPDQIDLLIAKQKLNVLSTNEIRAELNRDPISAGGDDVLSPGNLVPLGETIDTEDTGSLSAEEETENADESTT